MSIAVRIVRYLVLGAALAEFFLFILGYPSNSLHPDIMPGSSQSDPIKGWVHKPGAYQFVASDSKREIDVRFLPDGSRATSLEPNTSSQSVVLLGCSFVEGFGLSDHETFAWKLQEKLPNIHIRNFGAGGYGTLHSLLTEKELLDSKEINPPKLIIYGFADFHVQRNIMNPLTQRYWETPGIFPYCDEQGCKTWPGKSMKGYEHSSRLYSLFENAIETLMVLRKQKQAEDITIDLIEQMRDQAKAHAVRFIVAPVSLEEKKWLNKFKEHQLEVVYCPKPGLSDPKYRLSDGHPNALWSEEFAQCLRNNQVLFN